MSKRFSRSSKKSTSDDNAGNFVFSFPGSPSPNQSFTFAGGSAPSSPIGSPAAFGTAQPPSSPSVPTFGAAPSSPSANSNVFVFGTGAGGASSTSSLPGSPKMNANFGGANNTAPNSPSSTLRRNVTEISQPTQPNTFTGAALRRSNSDLGTASSAFTFGSPANNPSAPSSAFTFGNSGQNQAMTSQPAPSSSTSTTSGQAAPASSTFSFGSAATATTTTPTTNTTTANTTAASPFSFGSAPTSGAPSSAGGFASPTIAPSTSSPAPAAFSFGSSISNATKSTAPPASSTGTSAFSFGSPAPPPTGSPSVGGTTSQFSAGSSPAFSFGTPPTAQKTDTNTTNTPSFSLKMPAPSSTTASSTPAASPFGGSSSTAPATSTTTTTTATATTPSTTTTATTSAPTFAFSIPSTSTAKAPAGSEKKDDKSAAPSASLFSFGSTAAKPTTTTTTSATSTAATPAISGLPSFSATKPTTTTTTPATTITTTSAPNAFSFTATLANLDKTAQQPPNQIGAALITPSLNALRQNQVVTHTNFRIDNILPNTRFTELPEQARKELDELAQYIHDESQRCDYIKKRAAPKRQDTMKEAKHEYEILSYKLDSLSNSLQMQVNAVEELFDLLKEQIRHFNDGQSVLDAWKHPGGHLAAAARRLSGYSNDDDYFMALSTRLAIRMEEYKNCIRQIEFTTDSWTKNHAQSPQDIARIMASQNQTFLALTNQVAALHETLKLEQDLYSQYRFQAITL